MRWPERPRLEHACAMGRRRRSAGRRLLTEPRASVGSPGGGAKGAREARAGGIAKQCGRSKVTRSGLLARNRSPSPLCRGKATETLSSSTDWFPITRPACTQPRGGRGSRRSSLGRRLTRDRAAGAELTSTRVAANTPHLADPSRSQTSRPLHWTNDLACPLRAARRRRRRIAGDHRRPPSLRPAQQHKRAQTDRAIAVAHR